MSPQCDQEIHRHQHHFPEQEKQEQIEREEHADHAAENPQQVQVEETGAALDLAPRAQYRENADKPGEDHQGQRQAVHAEVQADAEVRNPRLPELHLPLGRIVNATCKAVVADRPQPQ